MFVCVYAINYMQYRCSPELDFSWCVCRRSCAANREASLCWAGPRNHGVHLWRYPETPKGHQWHHTKHLHPQRSECWRPEPRPQVGVYSQQEPAGMSPCRLHTFYHDVKQIYFTAVSFLTARLAVTSQEETSMALCTRTPSLSTRSCCLPKTEAQWPTLLHLETMISLWVIQLQPGS